MHIINQCRHALLALVGPMLQSIEAALAADADPVVYFERLATVFRHLHIIGLRERAHPGEDIIHQVVR